MKGYCLWLCRPIKVEISVVETAYFVGYDKYRIRKFFMSRY